jgi:Uma2 family endonuclease
MNAVLPKKHLFDVNEWHRLADSGFFDPEYRAELILGEIIDMPPIGLSHRSCVDWLTNWLGRRLPDEAWLSVQNPLRLGDLSEPCPDIAILRYREDCYRQSPPGPDDCLLIIEVADTSLRYDRGTKAGLYARFGIPEYWIVNLGEGCIEVHRGA